MNTQTNPQQDSMVNDGGDLTPEEARLMAEGLEHPDDEDDAATLAATRQAAKDAADAEEAAVTAAAEAQSSAAQVAAVTAQAPVAPAAPMDFEAARTALAAEYNEGDMSAIQLSEKREAILRAELQHDRAMDAFNREKAEYDTALAAQGKAVESDWNKAALAFETANKDFLSNPMRHADMQRAIALEHQKATAAGESVPASVLLDRAAKTAMEYSGYKPATPTTVKDALDARKPGAAGRTLGDVPGAGSEKPSGNEAFSQLDGMAIEDLEEATANMTPKQLEAFLRDSPGSNSKGRGVDPGETE